MALRLLYQNGEKEVIPQRLAKPQPFTLTGLVSTQEQFINAQPLNGLKANDRIIFNLGNELVSMRQAWIQFRLTGDPGTTPAIQCAMVPDIQSIFGQFRILAGSKVLIDIADYGQLQNICNLTFSELYENGAGKILVATDTNIVDRRAYFLNPNKTYCCKLGFRSNMLDLLKQDLWLNKLGANFRIEITLKPNNQVITTDIAVTGTEPTYTLNGVELHYHNLLPELRLNNMINEQLNLNGFLPYTFRSFDRITDSSVMKIGSTSFSKTLTFKYANVLSIFVVFEKKSVLTNFENDEKRRYFFNPGVTKFKVQLNGTFHPNSVSQRDCDNYTAFLLNWGLSSEQSTQAAKNWNYNGNAPARASFSPAVNFSKYVENMNNPQDLPMEVIGIDTSTSVNMELSCEWDTAAPEDMVVSFYAYHTRVWAINANGSSLLNF